MLENVSDTARWVAVYRAMETERPDAIFRDPFARSLAGQRGVEIMHSMRRGKSAAWAMIVRTAVMDDIIMEAVNKDRVDMIVNLAAGLDARPWRLPLPPSLKWIDVDFGPILEYKNGIIGNARPVCHYEAAHVDLRDADARKSLFARLGSESNNALIVAEGLLIYLSPENVGALAADLHETPAFKSWLIDLGTPRLLRMMRRTWGKRAAAADAQFKFAPEEGTRFFEKFGWTEQTRRFSFAEAVRLNREMPGAGVMRFVMKFLPARTRTELQTMASIVLLRRKD